MQLDHSFTVGAGVDRAWQILTDLGQIAPHIPGAKITSTAPDLVAGSLKVKLGPLNLNYQGSATLAERDDVQHSAVIAADGVDARNGSAKAAMTARLAGTDDTTTVSLTTELELTGKPAQFGVAIMEEVGARIVGQFADKLAAALSAAVSSTAGDAESVAAEPAPVEAVPDLVADTTPAVEREPVTDTISADEPAEPSPAEPRSAVPEPVVPNPAAPNPAVRDRVPSSSATAPAIASASTSAKTLSDTMRPIVAKRLAPVAVALVFAAAAVRRRRSS